MTIAESLATAVMLITINGNYTVDTAVIPFDSLGTCEQQRGPIESQIKEARPVMVHTGCYLTVNPDLIEEPE